VLSVVWFNSRGEALARQAHWLQLSCAGKGPSTCARSHAQAGSGQRLATYVPLPLGPSALLATLPVALRWMPLAASIKNSKLIIAVTTVTSNGVVQINSQETVSAGATAPYIYRGIPKDTYQRLRLVILATNVRLGSTCTTLAIGKWQQKTARQRMVVI
jgi:hypothetical protein